MLTQLSSMLAYNHVAYVDFDVLNFASRGQRSATILEVLELTNQKYGDTCAISMLFVLHA